MFVYVDCSHDITWYSSPLFPQTRLWECSHDIIWYLGYVNEDKLHCFVLVSLSFQIEKGSGGLSYNKGCCAIFSVLYFHESCLSSNYLFLFVMICHVLVFIFLWYILFSKLVAVSRVQHILHIHKLSNFSSSAPRYSHHCNLYTFWITEVAI